MGATYADDPLTRRHYSEASHADVLARHPAFAWEAAVDTDAASLDKARARWGFAHGAASVAELGAQYQPEVLVLATPPQAYTSAVAACPGLKAVLCEKPLGASLTEARAFLDLCTRQCILVQVNFWRRCDPFYRRLAGGELAALVGPPQAISAIYGNGLRNNGSHLVDFCRMLFGEIAGVHALGPALHAGMLPLAGDFDAACALQFASGATATLQPIDFRHYREIGLDVWGEGGRLEVLSEGLVNRLSRRAPHRALSGASEVAADAPQMLPPTIGEALYAVYDNLAAALEGRSELWSPGASALQTAVAIDAIERAVGAGDGRVQAIKAEPSAR
jgi:predicted dehydrogenase